MQVNYLGYPGTMGAPFIDYIVADEFIVPRDRQMLFAEKLAYLPDCCCSRPFCCRSKSRKSGTHAQVALSYLWFRIGKNTAATTGPSSNTKIVLSPGRQDKLGG